MDRDEAHRKYLQLKQEHASGRLAQADFRRGIEELRYQDENKNWWHVTEDGTCLKWDGSVWQTTGERVDTGDASPAAAPAAEAKAPGGSKAGSYIKHVLIRIPFVILTFFTTWVIHTYLLAGPNGGFGRGSAGSWVYSYWGNFIPATVLWGLISGFFWMIVFTYFKLGRKNFLPTIAKAPMMMIERVQQGGTPGVGALLVGVGLALFFSPFNVITGNVGFGIALFLAVFGLSSLGWAIARVIARFWIWIVRDVVKKPEEKYGVSLGAAHLVMVGLIPGFVVSLVLKGALGFVTGLILMVLGVFLFFEIKSPTISNKTTGFVLCVSPLILQMVMMVCFPDSALADNGGKAEAGGTWAAWWGSQGYMRVLIHGLPPSIAAALGALFPTLTPEKLIAIPPEAAGPIKPDMVLADSLKFGDVPFSSAPIPVSIDTSRPEWDVFSPTDGEVSLINDGPKTISQYSPKVLLLQAITNGLKVAGFACDTAMSALSNVTGPWGKALNFGYIGTKNVAGEMSGMQAKFVRGETEYETLSDAYKDAAVNGVMKGAVESAAEIAGGLIGQELGFNKYASGIYDYLAKKNILTTKMTSNLVQKLAGYQKDYFQYFTKYTRMDLRHGVDIPGAIKEVIQSVPGEVGVQLGGEASKYATDPVIDAVVYPASDTEAPVIDSEPAPQTQYRNFMYTKPGSGFRP